MNEMAISSVAAYVRPARVQLSRGRALVNVIMTGLCGLAVGLALVPLASLLWLVVSRGIGALSWSFFTHLPAPVGEVGGGIGNSLVGTLYLVALASLIGLPLGIGTGLYLAEHGDGRLGGWVRAAAEVLAGVPSIVIGVVAYGLVVAPLHHFSALAGALALAILMIPTLARASEEVIRLVPQGLREASLALGVPGWKTSLRVVLPTAFGALLQAALLAVARAAGETAPLLFTSFNNQYWNLDPRQPMAALPIQIFNYAISPYADWQEKAWGAAFCLLFLIGLLNLSARVMRRGARS